MSSKLDQLRELDLARQQAHNPASVLNPRSQRRGPLAGIAALLVFLLVKTKGVLFLALTKLKFLTLALQALKLSKFLLTFSTMWISIALYSRIYGFWFAFGLVLLILVHELGHGYCARLMNIKVGAPIFIPFVGAVIALRQTPRTTWENCVIACGGPLFGLLGGLVVLGLAHFDLAGDSRSLFYGLAYFSFFLNLFNLFPFFGLDGDRIASPLNAWSLFLTGVGLVAFSYYLSKLTNYEHPLLLLIGLLMAFKSFGRRKRATEPSSALEKLDQLSRPEPQESTDERHHYYALAIYIGLAISLATLAAFTAPFVLKS